MADNNVFCLFDSGDFAQVSVEKHENDPGEPVQGFFILDGGAGFSLAAKRAAVRVYSELKNQGISIPKFSAMFDLSMTSPRDLMNLSGQSGGLSFALALASKITGKKIGSIAATGIIGAEGFINKVKQSDFGSKMDAAFRALPRGGIIFYPRDNHISSEIKEMLKSKGIECIPVTTVSQALRVAGIYDDVEKPDIPLKKEPSKSLAVFVVLLLLFAAALIYLYASKATIAGSGNREFDLKAQEDQIDTLPEIIPTSEPFPEKDTVLDKGFN